MAQKDAVRSAGLIEAEVIEEVVAHWAAAVAESPDYRVLRRFLPERDLPPESLSRPGLHHGVFVDLETTGLDPKEDKIIELAAVPFAYLGTGEVVYVGPGYEALEHPGRPIPAEITKLTGITDDAVLHQAIDDDRVFELVRDAELVVAHNAAFDRPFFERRFPALVGKPWGCSYRDVDWKGHGFRHATVEDLLREVRGQFTDHHRAMLDAQAALHVLGALATIADDREDTPIDGGTWLAQLLRSVNTPTLRLLAWGAPFAMKDDLKRRGYRWDAPKKVWYLDLPAASPAAEAERVRLSSLVVGYSTVLFTARDRYSERVRID